MPAHSAEPAHATGPGHTTAGEWSAVKARSHWRTEVVVIHLVEMVEMVEMVEVIEVMETMETIDKDEAHAPADEKRRPPIPGVGIRVGHDRVPRHATIRALHDPPCPVTLQARTSDDLLHRAVDFYLPDDRAAIGVARRHG